MIFNLGQIKFASPSKKIILNELVNIEKSNIQNNTKTIINFEKFLEIQNVDFGYLDKKFNFKKY